MPTRLIREGLLTSDRVNLLTEGGEIFYRRLLNVADDHACFDARNIILLAACYPLRIDKIKTNQIEAWKQECAELKLIKLYTVAGKQFLKIDNFRQLIRAKPKYPSPDGATPDSGVAEGSGKKESASTAKDEAVDKKRYGELKKVLLTDEEYSELKKKNEQPVLDAAIEILDGFIGQNSKNEKRYTSHYAVLKEGSWVWDRVSGVSGRDNQRRGRTIQQEYESYLNELAGQFSILLGEDLTRAMSAANDKHRGLIKSIGKDLIRDAKELADRMRGRGNK